jgi:5-methylcytosine-specific restriction endonuclease McrA
MDTHKDNKGVRLVCECFRQYLSVHDDQQRSENSVKWLLEDMDITDCGIVFLDPSRVFPAEMIEQVLRLQNNKCWVTGKTLSIKDAVGGHIVAHSEGGKTTIDNCMVCHKDENSRMGSMDATMYRQIRQEELGTLAA